MGLETHDKLTELEAKIDRIWTSVEKTRKYFLAVLWITVILFILPLIALIFVIPTFIRTYTGVLGF